MVKKFRNNGARSVVQSGFYDAKSVSKSASGEQGFTIIEVMIVLAIAALILLIVLLAVPALQRNSRNTTVKNDAASVAGGINTFESDNNGTTPGYVSGTGSVKVSGGTCSASANPTETISVNGSTVVNCGLNGLSTSDTIGSDVSSDSNAKTSNIYAQIGNSCPANGSAVSTAPSSSRSVALYYVIETSGGRTLQCTSS